MSAQAGCSWSIKASSNAVLSGRHCYQKKKKKISSIHIFCKASQKLTKVEPFMQLHTIIEDETTHWITDTSCSAEEEEEEVLKSANEI